ncbi:VOC family protein [Arthrobacter globiformis]|uniref:VOC family protein n=1 Tax=Arthrobacter globiformis TaxID=1665 RepID=UPI00278A18FC|nr:VOC family protein [Arthrobacter globiformis]MDQ0865174.1 PhnB protein [Arthrobacter globiformis]
MSTLLNPYISFRDNARDAMTFYQSVFGGELALSTFGEFQASEDPAEADKIMHGMLTSEGLVLMGADTPNSMDYSPGTNISVSLSGDDEAELRGYYDKLSGEGGSVTVPMDKAPWGDIFGMCTDRFGIAWLVNVNTGAAAPAS